MPESDVNAWVCTVCGYVHQGPEPPEACPVCGAPASDFEPYKEPAAAGGTETGRWLCLNCSYVHDGNSPPDVCPVCGVGPEHFEESTPVENASPDAEVARLVIAGGGIAGLAAAESARDASPGTEITLVCREEHLPYYRINLTRYLAGEVDLGSLPVKPESWYSDHDIALKMGKTAERVDPETRTLHLCDGEVLEYDSLILAMGSHPFVPPIPGSELEGVMTLRTIEDASDILSAARNTGPCVVIGGGILGIETAAALARQEADVTLIESYEWLMPRQLNRKAGDILEKHMTDIGVTLKKNVRTSEILGSEKAEGILLNNGETVPAELVVLTTGVRPNTCLARKSGIEVDKGITVDSNLATSLSGVFAAGDVAEHDGRLYGVWAASQYQGSIAGLNAVGQPTHFGGIPRSNTLKVLGIDLLSIGDFEPEDGSFVVLDHQQNNEFAHFVFRDGKMTGCILLGHADLGTRIKKSIESGHDFSALLRDAETGADIVKYVKQQ